MDFDFPKRNITNELRLIFAIRVIGTSVFSFLPPFFPPLIFTDIFPCISEEMMSRTDYLYLWLKDISDKTPIIFPHLLHQLLLTYLLVYYSSWKSKSEVRSVKLCTPILTVLYYSIIVISKKKMPSRTWFRNLLTEATFGTVFSSDWY